MTRRLRPPSCWSLYDEASQDTAHVLDGSHVVVPALPSSPLTPLLSGLTPDRDHNGDLMRCLRGLPRGRPAHQPVFAIFAADPFLNVQHLARRLLERGYKRIVNWPTTAQYGADFCRGLDSVNLGPRQEYKNLLALAEQSLSISLAVCGAEAATEIAHLRPELVFLTPSFDSWTKGRLRAGELLRRCTALARSIPKETRIVLMVPRGVLSLPQARRAGASALLLT